MALTIAKGTKEILPVDIDDSTGVVTSLAALSPKYDLMKDDDTFVYNQATATTSGMRMDCLIDATAAGPSGLLPVAHYRLFVSFTVGTEIPRLGPIDVYIRDKTS